MKPCRSETETPTCHKSCESSYNVSYQQDKHFGLNVTSFKSVESIQTEIMMNGPVEGGIDIYEDFISYKTGYCRHPL